MGGGSAHAKCGLFEQIIFFTAILAGTACSICSKVMMQIKGSNSEGEQQVFGKPIFQTFGMFVGMLFALVMHWVVIAFKIPFPGYSHYEEAQGSSDEENGNGRAKSSTYGATDKKETDTLLQKKTSKPLSRDTPVWMYFFLAIPSVFDLGATALCMMGLLYLDVSVYILLRGSGIIFVALMKQHVLGDHLFRFQWLGVGWNVVSVIMVGSTAILNSKDDTRLVDPHQAALGVFFVLAGAFVQSLQFVFEEKVMHMDIPAPPLLLVGMEGFWGTVLSLVIVYPIAYYLPGNDHGSYEDPFNTWYMFLHNTNIQIAFVIYFVTIFCYNLFAILVTYLLNSVWHGILDNFRPITVWGTDLLIYYFIIGTGEFGEPWTRWSWIQVAGLFVLLYGTSIYNAPNSGSIKMDGSWYALGINLQSEYDKLEEEQREHELDAEFQKRKAEFKDRRESSFFGERSPYTSLHTQALRGFGSPKI